MRFIICSFLLGLSLTGSTQKTKLNAPPKAQEPQATMASRRLEGIRNREKAEQNSIAKNIEFRNIGPTIMSGRVTDIEADPADPTHFYVSYASGGVFYTSNNGTTFTPIFDDQSSITVGDIAVNWKAQNVPEIWVGTGESNSSRSSYAGTGIFVSPDGGKTWEHRGLDETQHIGKILLHPTQIGTAWVAAIGHLYSSSVERGVYKTTDGGRTWKKTLFIDAITGVIDLIPDPINPDVLYAIAWQRERRAWNFVEGGPGTGIWKSTDGGETWKPFTTASTGFPSGDAIGRIGLSIFQGNPSIMYAVVDNQTFKTSDTTKNKGLTPTQLRTMTGDQFLQIDVKQLGNFLNKYKFPKQYTAASIREQVKSGKLQPIALADFVSDANVDLFNRPIIGAEIYRTDDGGLTWKKANTQAMADLFYTYGYYFGKIWVSPSDANDVFVAGVGLMHSIDGGKTWKSSDGENQHGDHHALWINPKRKGHLINGNDGGINISWDNGANWFKANTPAVGQFYAINVDMAKPYNVYGGLQDNGVWTGPSTYQHSMAWYGEGQYPWRFIYGGDGMQVMIDPRDNNTVYTGYQFGHYARINKSTGESSEVRPTMKLGDAPLRFNWQTPIWLSVHNPDILYMGAQRLFRSLDKGDHFEAISPDLTRGGRIGDVPYGTISSIHESPLQFGLLYAGSDDGLIHVSQDGGANWTRISDALPQYLRVSRVIASAHNQSRVYIALNGFVWDHFEAYVYLSDDYGATWKRIATDLPTEPVNVIREDPVNPNLLFIGTDNGLYFSLDRGQSVMRMTGGLPVVAVHDIVIHPRDHELIVGTHGRSVYVGNITELENYTDSIHNKSLHIFDFTPYASQSSWSDEESPPVYSGRLAWSCNTSDLVTIEIRTGDEACLLLSFTDSSEKGLNFHELNLVVDSTQIKVYREWMKKTDKQAGNDTEKPIIGTGDYTIVLVDKAGNRVKKSFKIRE